MVAKLFVIYDKVAQDSSPVFEARNVAVGQRMMKNFLLRDDENGKKDPNEFALLCIGKVDHDTNLVHPLELPEDVTQAIEDFMKIEGENDAKPVQNGTPN